MLNLNSFIRHLKGLLWLIKGTPAQKRRSRLELARISAGLFGDFPLGEDNKVWLKDTEFREMYNLLSPLSPYAMERKWNLREFARYSFNIPGELAECGCYDGSSAFFLAQTFPETPLHLFDSFEGLSEPDENDLHIDKNAHIWKKGDLAVSEKIIEERLRDFKNIHIHKGWIPEIFTTVKEKEFRFIHIDVDLFQPTKDSLDFFYPRLNKGGVIILDDAGFATCPGALKATDCFLKENQIDDHLLSLSSGQCIIFKH